MIFLRQPNRISLQPKFVITAMCANPLSHQGCKGCKQYYVNQRFDKTSFLRILRSISK
jgi:hypothetical protein